jgi:hypothetical protein
MIKLGRMRWIGHVAKKRRNTYWILIPKPEGKRAIGRYKHEWEGNTKIDLIYEGLCGLDSTGSVYGR